MLQQKLMYLLNAYIYAIENINVVIWEECCASTMIKLDNVGASLATKFRTVQMWNIELCRSLTFQKTICDPNKINSPLFQMYPLIRKVCCVFVIRTWWMCLSSGFMRSSLSGPGFSKTAA